MYHSPTTVNGLSKIEIIMKDAMVEEMVPRHPADCDDLVGRTLNMYQGNYDAGDIDSVAVYDDADGVKLVPAEDFFGDNIIFASRIGEEWELR